MEFKTALQNGFVAEFRGVASDDFLTCRHLQNEKWERCNGFHLEFNSKREQFKRFSSFERRVKELVRENNLERDHELEREENDAEVFENNWAF